MIREFIDVNAIYNTHMDRRTLGIRWLIDTELGALSLFSVCY